MIITYHGHSCFKLKGKRGTVVTDPYADYVGFSLSSQSADIVTVSHDHQDHNQVSKVKGTARREQPFIINHAGEYEVDRISVFGTELAHDANGGVERGGSIAFTILLDDMRVCHLGDLGHPLTEEQVAKIGMIDVLLVPVGGVYTIDPQQAVAVINALNPSIVIPMHYKTPEHNAEVFGELKGYEEFLKALDTEVAPVAKLQIEREQLPEEMEVVVLQKI